MLSIPALLLSIAGSATVPATVWDGRVLRPTHAKVEPVFATCGWRRGEILEASGRIETGGLTGTFVRRVETGSGRLLESDDLGIVASGHGFDGGLAWSQDMSGGVHDLNSSFARELASSMAWLDGRQGCAPSPQDGMTRIGSRRDRGRRFVAWQAAPPGGVPFELWYDAKTGRLNRAFFQMAESRLIRHFAEWRDVGGGRLVAFEQREEFPEDEDETVSHISRASVRKVATDRDFTRPLAPSDTTFLNGLQSTSVPFEDDHRTRIYIPVYLNGKGPFLFELDNGGHNIMTTEAAEALGLTATGSFNSTGAGNTVAQSGIARVARLQIGDAVLTNQAVKIRKFSPSSNDRSPNAPRAGILGLELFERFMVSIDPRAKAVTLARLGSLDRPPGVAIPCVFAEDAPLIAGSYLGVRGEFMLDSGNAGPTIIEDYWARSRGLSPALGKGVPRGDAKISIGSVGVGPIELQDELVSYYGPAERGSEYSRAVAGVYGQPLLSRFKSTYDYSRNTVWLDPLAAEGPVPADRSGLSLAKTETGLFKVAAVIPGSPADQEGIRTDDLISTLQGMPSPTLSRADAAAILKERVGKTVVLSGTFRGVQGAKTVKLQELVKP